MEYASAARIPTMWGPFTAHCYRSILDGIEHIAMVKVRTLERLKIVWLLVLIILPLLIK